MKPPKESRIFSLDESSLDRFVLGFLEKYLLDVGQTHEASPPISDLDDVVASDSALQFSDSSLENVFVDKACGRKLSVLLKQCQKPDLESQGVSVLFHGLPGTGKTMAAKAISSDLMRPYLLISGGDITDKYFGESEKRLTEAFEKAQQYGAVLILDEVDSLLVRRDKASHQHYANLTNHLLLLLEKFSGIVILCTNFRTGLDPAVSRRMSRSVEFGLPGAEERYLIWYDCLGSSGIIHPGPYARFFSVFPLTGALIRNAVSQAASERDFGDRTRLRFSDLLDATSTQVEEMRNLVKAYNIRIKVS